MRKKALSLTIEVLDESEKMSDAKPEVKESTRNQLLTLMRSCVLALGQTAETLSGKKLAAPKPAQNQTTGKIYRVQVGAFSTKSNADKLAAELKAKGYSVVVKAE